MKRTAWFTLIQQFGNKFLDKLYDRLVWGFNHSFYAGMSQPCPGAH